MKKILILVVCLFTTAIYAQSYPFKISGKLVSEEDQVPLESATVFLQREQDSTLLTYTITNKDGVFLLEDKAFVSNAELFISYVGYQSYSKKIDLEKTPELNLETIQLASDANRLDEVVVRAVAPVTVKKDTLEFNVKSFKTKKDASVEDLLKELPGVEVDEEGKIKVNGKEVNKILVNGKPFFGDDPTITTRNLTKDIIEKVQITDTKSKSEAFAGEEGDQENKTINLTIKEENNKGTFGRLAGGLGSDKRFEFAGIVNRFDNDRRISVLAGGNNINSPGFSFGEIQKMFGGGRSVYVNSNGSFVLDGRAFGGGEGITRSRNIGANYADVLGEKVDINSDYFYSASNSDNETVTSRENILPDARYFTNANSRNSSNNDNHSGSVALDIELDSTFLVNINPEFTITRGNSKFSNMERTTDEAGVLTNESTNSSVVDTKGNNFRNNIDITKRFGKNGAFLKWNMSNEFNTTETDDYLNSDTEIYGDTPESIVRNQFTDGERKLNSFYSSVTYRLPLVSKTFFLDAKYSLRSDRRDNKESTFDFNTTSQTYSDFNTDLSTNFIYKNRRSTPALELTYKKEKFTLSVEGGYVFRTLENEDKLRPNFSIKRDFNALELGSYFNMRFNPKMSMYMGYSLSNSPPDLTQIQPFQDVSDPLNTITGNPDLKPTNRHSVYFGFNNYNFQKGSGFYAYANLNVAQDEVVSKTTVDEDFVRNTTYANVNGNYRYNLSAYYSKSVKLDTLRTLKFSLGTWGNANRSINFNNDIQYASKSNSVTPNMSVTFNWKEVFEFRPSYNITFTKTSFDVVDFSDQKFSTHSFRLRTATFVPKKLEWRNDIAYNYNPNVADGFQKDSWFWNTTFAYSILNDAGTISVKIYDLLNQNTNARRTATANFIQDSQSTVLQRYVMFGFSWKFNSLGKKGETSSNIFFHD